MSASPVFEQPLVSVIIPTYNQARYVEAAIDSVLAQDHPAVELVVVDDGSTDATPDILRRYGDRITTLTQGNRGAANALNRGIRAATGSLVCWLSSDDVFLPGKLSRQVAAFRDDPGLALCHTGFVTMDADGLDLRDWSAIEPIHPDPFVAVFWSNPINGSTVMMPRAIFDEVGLFDETLRADVDGDMWLRVLRTHRLRQIPGAYLRYRVHGAALSANRGLMHESKSRVRLARIRDGALVAHLRAWDPAQVAATLAAMSRHYARIGQPDLARALLAASLRNGIAWRAQVSAVRMLIVVAIPGRLRSLSGSRGSLTRKAARRARRLVRAVARRV